MPATQKSHMTGFRFWKPTLLAYDIDKRLERPGFAPGRLDQLDCKLSSVILNQVPNVTIVPVS